MATSNVLLLIEPIFTDQTQSLARIISSDEQLLSIVHTPETAVEKIKTLWPDMIIFNLSDNRLNLSNFQKPIKQLELNLPYLIVGNKDKIVSKIAPEAVWVPKDNPQQLAYGISRTLAKQTGRFIRLPTLIVDQHQSRVLHQQIQHSLTPKELKLLKLLVERHDQILSRKEIMSVVWETDYMGDTRTLDVHIRWVRKKIEDNPSRPTYLKTVRGEGYIFITRTLKSLK